MPHRKAGNISSSFLLFFFSQSALGFGGFLQVVAAAALLVASTRSGIAAGFGIVCAPLPGVLLSLFAGKIGDSFPVRRILILIDLARGFLTLLFLLCRSPLSAFFLLLLLNSFDVFYNPAKNKMLASIVEKEKLIVGNSILSGGYGVISIVSPVIAGLLIGNFGLRPAFLLNSAAFFLSACLLAGIRTGKQSEKREPFAKAGRLTDIRAGIAYCVDSMPLKNAVVTSAFLDFCSISVNIAFYSLAFDTLKVSGTCWGLMLSTLYGMSVFSMLILMAGKKRFESRPLAAVRVLLFVLSAVWFLYGSARGLFSVFAGEAAEGLSMSLCGTLLTAAMLKTAKPEYTARVMGVRDFLSYCGKLLSVGVSYLVLAIGGNRVLFRFNALLMLLFAAWTFAHKQKPGGPSPVRRRLRNSISLRRNI